MAWEYKQLVNDEPVDEEVLNDLGRKDFEIVTFVVEKSAIDDSCRYVYLFKRHPRGHAIAARLA